ncbi:MarR family transcriptional regulator [Desulfoscipio sp. XC116]|uniref:MarR family transcriptional regulator n=1 Tax=Desulfoscipio sp. XC116 TaxID=3144975 RepID=UPI00325A95DB
MDFTPKQLQYLFYLDFYQNSGRLVSDLAEQLGVSKAAVSQLLDFYETKGLIKRDPSGGTSLIGEAKAAAATVKEKYELIRPFFRRMPELTVEMARQCALRYVCWMPRESVDGLARALIEKDKLNGVRWDLYDQAAGRRFPFADGKCQVPFDVFKKDSDEISMGDKGFVKPAQMTVLNGRGAITLVSREIRYRSKAGASLRGRLTRLSCLYGGGFVQVKPKKNKYLIPLHYIRKISRVPDGTLCGTLRIRAEVGRCAGHMPPSEADILFRFTK